MTTKRGPFLLPRDAGEERQPHFQRADAWLRALMILARLLGAIILLTPLHAAENGAAPSSLNVPEGAEELGRFGAWAVFEYPRDPSRRCHVGTLAPPGGDAVRLLVDADAEFLTLIPPRADGPRQFVHRGWFEDLHAGRLGRGRPRRYDLFESGRRHDSGPEPDHRGREIRPCGHRGGGGASWRP